MVGEQKFPQLYTAKNYVYFKLALRHGRRAMISPALNGKKLHIIQALRRGRKAMISPALNTKNYVYFKLFIVVGEQ